jgi:hypothetical protein
MIEGPDLDGKSPLHNERRTRPRVTRSVEGPRDLEADRAPLSFARKRYGKASVRWAIEGSVDRPPVNANRNDCGGQALVVIATG